MIDTKITAITVTDEEEYDVLLKRKGRFFCARFEYEEGVPEEIWEWAVFRPHMSPSWRDKKPGFVLVYDKQEAELFRLMWA